MATFRERLNERRQASGRPTVDLTTAEGLRAYAISRGIDPEKVAEEKKLSMLQRVGRGLGAFELNNALYQSRYEGKSFAIEYVKDIFQELGTALTGREMQDDQTPKKTFKDILVKEGWKDREGKPDWADVVGFLGDVVVDPTTFFGGWMAKGATRATKGVVATAGKLGDRVAPVATGAARALTARAKDAVGELFVPYYKVSGGIEGQMRLRSLENRRGAITAAKQSEAARMFEGVSVEVGDDIINNLQPIMKAFGQSREALIKHRTGLLRTEINYAQKEYRRIARQLRGVKNVDRATRRKITQIEKSIRERLGLLDETITKQLPGEVDEVTKIKPIGTIPRQYLGDAVAARKMATFEEFATSSLAAKLQKPSHSIALDAAGFKSLKDFYIKAKGGIKESIVKPKVKLAKELTEAQKRALQKGIMKDLFKLDDLKFIDLENTEDSIKVLEGLLKRTENIEDVAKTALKNVFEDSTKPLIKRFDQMNVTPRFELPESARQWPKIKKSIAKYQDEFAKQTGMDRDLLLSTFLPQHLKEQGRKTMAGIRVSKQGYLKRMRGILNKEDIETDLARIYSQSASQVAVDNMITKEMDRWVAEFGKPKDFFSGPKEALDNGYVMLRRKGQFGEEVGWVPKWDAKIFNEMTDPGFKTLNELAQASGFDWMTNTFKRWVTGLPFISFFTRNIFGGEMQNAMIMGLYAFHPGNKGLAVKLTKEMLLDKAVKGTIKLGDNVYKPQQLIKPFMERFGLTSSYIADFNMTAAQKLVKQNRWFEASRAIGNAIETQQKMTVYVGMMRKGYSINQSLSFAEKAGFDYGAITPFEKHVLRRIIPFYTFSRKNMELQLTTLLNNPQRLGTLTKVGRSAGTPQGAEPTEGSDKDLFVADWMRDRFMMRLGESKYGLPQVISGFGSPLEESAELLDNGVMGILARMNPAFKLPLELGLGQDFFYRRDLKSVYSAKEYAEAPQFVKDWLQITEVPKPVYRGGEPTGEVRIDYVADPERLKIARSLFTSRGVSYFHTIIGDAELDTSGRILKALTGFRPYEVDEQTTEYFLETKNYRDLMDLLKPLGLVGTFERAYEKEPIE